MSIRITDDLAAVDREKLAGFLKDAAWQSGIGPETLSRALENSICVSAFSGLEQIGFARAVSDKATFCWIDDVYVDLGFRGKGIAGQLIEAILTHKDLQSVATWFLSSGHPDARKVFSRYGFSPLPEERSIKLMALPKVQNESYRS